MGQSGKKQFGTCCLLPEEGSVTVWHEAVDIVDEMLQYSCTTYVMLCLFLFSLLLVPVLVSLWMFVTLSVLGSQSTKVSHWGKPGFFFYLGAGVGGGGGGASFSFVLWLFLCVFITIIISCLCHPCFLFRDHFARLMPN